MQVAIHRTVRRKWSMIWSRNPDAVVTAARLRQEARRRNGRVRKGQGVQGKSRSRWWLARQVARLVAIATRQLTGCPINPAVGRRSTRWWWRMIETASVAKIPGVITIVSLAETQVTPNCCWPGGMKRHIVRDKIRLRIGQASQRVVTVNNWLNVDRNCD